MFYTDKCHLVRTINIAKFNYNEIPCAYTTFEHGFFWKIRQPGNNQRNQNSDLPMVAVYPEHSIS